MAVSAHTLVAPLRPACLGGGHLFVLLVLLLRRPFPGVLLLLILRRGLIADVLLVRLVLRCEELRTTAPIHIPPRPDLPIPNYVFLRP